MKGPKISEKIAKFLGRFSRGTLLAMIAGVSVLVFMVVLFLLTFRAQPDLPQQEQAANMVSVVVAKQDIPARAVVSESMLKVVSMPANLAPAEAAKDMQSVVGKVTMLQIMQGDVLTERKVLNDPGMAGFTGAIPPDCRAISIGITDITGIAGFAKAGDMVDVMLISDKKEKDKVVGEILFQNVPLLAVNKLPVPNTTPDASDVAKEKKDNMQQVQNQKTDAVQNRNEASKEAMTTVTLALRPEEALKLAVSQTEGTIYLVLRPFHPQTMFSLDTEYFDFKPATQAAQPQPAPAQQTMSVPQYSPPAAAAPAVPSESNDYGITIIRGGGK